MAETFNDKQLQEFAQTFYGYGNYHGDYWFVGMEEGGGDSFQDIANRLDAWSKRGKHELEDIVEYHAAMGVTRFFVKHPINTAVSFYCPKPKRRWHRVGSFR